MEIELSSNLTNTDVIQSLSKIGIHASEKSFLFGGKQVSAEYDGLKYLLRNKNGVLNIDIKVPVWVPIVSVISTMILASIIFSMIAGDAVIVRGGVIVLFIGYLIGAGIYKNGKSEKKQAFADKVSAGFREQF